MTLGVLLLATFLTVGFTGMCSFNPGRPDATGPVNRVDAETVLKLDSRGLALPLRLPQMPDNWIPNSARRVTVGKEPSSLVGWVIDRSAYISLTQTKAPLKAAKKPDDEVRTEVGTEEVSGVTWHKLHGDGNVRPIWVADIGSHRAIIKAMASEDNVRALASAFAVTKPFPTQVPRTGQPTSPAPTPRG